MASSSKFTSDKPLPATPSEISPSSPRKRKGIEQLRAAWKGSNSSVNDEGSKGYKNKGKAKESVKERTYKSKAKRSDDELSLKTEKRKLQTKEIETGPGSPSSSDIALSASAGAPGSFASKGVVQVRAQRDWHPVEQLSSNWSSDSSDTMSDLPASAFAAQVREPSEDEVFTPLNEDALSKLPRRLSDGMRELQHERSRTWADKVGAGNVRMASPSRPQSLLDSETRQAIQEAMDELSDDDFFEAPHDTAPSNTLSPGDARRNRAAIFAWHSPESGPAPQRVLRVINKSPHPSDAGDVPQEPRAPASSSSSSTSSHGIAEQIVPMAHWRAESARIGLPGPVVAGNNSRDPQLQVSVKEVGPFEEGRGEASSAGAAAGRSGFKDRLRRPFGNFSRKLRSKQTDEEGGKLAGSSAQVEPNVQRHVVDAALSTSSSRQEGGQTQRRRQKSPSKGSMTYRGQVENYD